jgi:hypothetical protein
VVAMRTTETAKQSLQDNLMDSFGVAGASTAAALSPDSALMLAPEAERLVEGLRTFGASTQSQRVQERGERRFY